MNFLEITFTVFRLAGTIPVENDKLVVRDISLLRGVWNNFRNLIETCPFYIVFWALKVYTSYKNFQGGLRG